VNVSAVTEGDIRIGIGVEEVMTSGLGYPQADIPIKANRNTGKIPLVKRRAYSDSSWAQGFIDVIAAA
jgi:hypothetical protein